MNKNKELFCRYCGQKISILKTDDGFAVWHVKSGYSCPIVFSKLYKTEEEAYNEITKEV